MNKTTTRLFALAAAILLTGCFPLHSAALHGNTTKVQRLLDQGTDVNEKGFANDTPLMGAAYGGHAEVVQLLLDKGADINATDRKGWTALMHAARAGRIECVRVLLERGARMDQTNHNGQNALDFARKKGRPEIVQLIETASRKGTTKEAAPPSAPATLSPPAESAAPF
jgi:ankyrin repeat protein